MTQTDVAVADPAAPAGTVAPVAEKPKYDPDWPYERIEFMGDDLAIRHAKMQALIAYQISSGKYISMERQNDASGLFITNHVGDESYDRLVERMSDPDDPDYTLETFGKFMGEIVRRSIEAIKAEREAEKAAELEAKGAISK
jgi:hypothetical protein